MILVTGGTGFIGGELVKHLHRSGQAFKLLLQPSLQPNLFPRGMGINVALSSLSDPRGVRASLQGVDLVFHLAGVERNGYKADFQALEVNGIRNLTEASVNAGVKRFFYLSHLGANRASAYSLMKAKGIAEGIIKDSGLNYTILRASMVYGTGDNFTLSLANLIRKIPFVTPVPGDGSVLLQPLWVEDLVTSLEWALNIKETENSILEIGGPEHLSFIEVLRQISKAIDKKRSFADFNPVRLASLMQVLENRVEGLPNSLFWNEYLAENRICALDSMPRTFGINPARFSQNLAYLKEKSK
ncbi:MAG: NAD(P)H-binding protein [Anaerolineaceae bacterium]|nr:NAD(P)H-binding protein [Anaerolineaceae bacterium]